MSEPQHWKPKEVKILAFSEIVNSNQTYRSMLYLL